MAIKFKSGRDVRKRHLILVIYGPPSAGKTSLALTASRPKLLDCDGGVHRTPMRALHEDNIAEVESWQDIANPEPSDFSDADTVIVDTVGTALDWISVDIIRSDPKRGRGGSLDLQGYGILKTRFAGWLNSLRRCGVDVVLVAHGAEEQRGDETVDRIIASGSSKQEVYQQADLIGRVSVESDGSRWLNFDPTAGSFGKNCGIAPRKLQNPLTSPHQLAEIINEARLRINEMVIDDQDEVTRLINLQKWIREQTTPELVTSALRRMLAAEVPAPDSDKRMLWEHARHLGFHYSRAGQAFYASEREAASAPPYQPPAPAPAAAPAAPQPAAAAPAPAAPQPAPAAAPPAPAPAPAAPAPQPAAPAPPPPPPPPADPQQAAAEMQAGPAAARPPLPEPAPDPQEAAARASRDRPEQPEIW